MILKGKIKSIPVTEVTKGMQVIDNKGIRRVKIFKGELCLLADWSNIAHPVNEFIKNHELKTLVVEYDDIQPLSGRPIIHIQLPLKYSQWQLAIDNGEVDSDKIIEFEVVVRDNKVNYIEVAKIIPQRKIYTEQQVKQILWEVFTRDLGSISMQHIEDVIMPSFNKWFEEKIKNIE